MNVLETISSFAVLAGAAVSVALVTRWMLARTRSSAARIERESRPKPLRNAKLLYMEKVFRIRYPIPLVAKLDRAYQAVDGSLFLVELKTRRNARVYPTDVIQLSAQKMALERQTGSRVSEVAFVTFRGPTEASGTTPKSQAVKLMSSEEMIALHWRREAILAGRTKPSYAISNSACGRCALLSVCDRPT